MLHHKQTAKQKRTRRRLQSLVAPSWKAVVKYHSELQSKSEVRRKKTLAQKERRHKNRLSMNRLKLIVGE